MHAITPPGPPASVQGSSPGRLAEAKRSDVLQTNPCSDVGKAGSCSISQTAMEQPAEALKSPTPPGPHDERNGASKFACEINRFRAMSVAMTDRQLKLDFEVESIKENVSDFACGEVSSAQTLSKHDFKHGHESYGSRSKVGSWTARLLPLSKR